MLTLEKSTSILRPVNVDRPDDTYNKLAKKLGIKPPPLSSDPLLRHVLSTLAIHVYDYSAVRNYLISKRPTDHFFVWVPAMTQASSRALLVKYGATPEGWVQRHRHGTISSRIVYNKPLPYPVLLTMDSINTEAKKVGFTPTFYVSDYAEKHEKPKAHMRVDPFLAVGTSDSSALFVIERWDEPGFREEVYSQKRKAGAKKISLAQKGVKS